MNIGARTAAWAKSGYTAKDYVQDHLLTQWDAEFGGLKDLRPNGFGDLQVVDGDSIDVIDGFWTSNGTNFIANPNSNGLYESLLSSDFTIETVADGIGFRFYLDNLDCSPIVRCTLMGVYGYAVNQSANPKQVVAVLSGDIISIYVNGEFKTSAEKSRVLQPYNRAYDVFESGHNSIILLATRKGIGVGGSAANLLIYNKALSAVEIAANYAIDNARFRLT